MPSPKKKLKKEKPFCIQDIERNWEKQLKIADVCYQSYLDMILRIWEPGKRFFQMWVSPKFASYLMMSGKTLYLKPDIDSRMTDITMMAKNVDAET